MTCRPHIHSPLEAASARPLALTPADPFTQHAARSTQHHRSRAFSLLEVMIACGIFFMAIFAILGMVSNSLRHARRLRHMQVDAGLVAAQMTKTNRLTEGTDSGDFGNLYPDYSWETRTFEAGSNGLWQADIILRRRGNPDPVDTLQIWLFSPDSSTLPGPRPR